MPDVLVSTPDAAYRADRRGRVEPFGEDDDQWLAAAESLHVAATSRLRSRRREHLYEGIGTALDILGDERVEAFARREWMGRRSYVDPLVVLADCVFWLGGRWLAALMLDDLRRAATDLTARQRGRILARRARIDCALGHLDEAERRYEYIAALASRGSDVELTALAALGFCTLARRRGEFSEVQARAPHALHLAEQSGNPALVRAAIEVLAYSEASRGRFGDAVQAGWRLFELSAGHDLWETEALVHVGRLLHDAGYPEQAAGAFAAALEREAPAHLLLRALGGLAMASALAGREATVEWTVGEVWRARAQSKPVYAVACAHLECAIALRLLGRTEEADRHRATATELAIRHHRADLLLRAAELDEAPRTPRRAELPAEALAVTARISALAPGQLPEELAFDAAPV